MNIRFLSLLISFCFFMLAQMVFSDNGKQALILQLKDGSRVAYYLESYPKITFSGSDLLLTTSDIKVYYPFDELQKYTFEKQKPSSILSSSAAMSSVQLSKDNISFKGMSYGEQIAIFTMDGHKVVSQIVGSDGSCVISLKALPAGIYVVQYGKSNIKILK